MYGICLPVLGRLSQRGRWRGIPPDGSAQVQPQWHHQRVMLTKSRWARRAHRHRPLGLEVQEQHRGHRGGPCCQTCRSQRWRLEHGVDGILPVAPIDEFDQPILADEPDQPLNNEGVVARVLDHARKL